MGSKDKGRAAIMDIEKLDGYEFEKLICSLLSKMGFFVEQTALSGDGGVDIIADYNQPILKGRYLIQCKRWSNTIGEPIVRDLFGTVLAQKANKGIIITNSFFSEKAREFAEGKNIELIDGNELNHLLRKYNIQNDVLKRHEFFYDMAGFEKDRYLYLKKRIDENKGEKQFYDNIAQFFHSYVSCNYIELNKNGLIDEYIKLNKIRIDKFCKRTKRDIEERKAIQYINGYLYLFKGQMLQALETFKDLGYFNELDLMCMSPTNYRYDYNRDSYGKMIVKNTSNLAKYVIIKNLMLIFCSLDFAQGMKILENLYKNAKSELMKNIYYEEMNEDISDYKHVGIFYRRSECDNLDKIAEHYNIKHIDSVFAEIKNNEYDKFHIPLGFKTGKDDYSGVYFYQIEYSEDVYIAVNDFIDNYLDTEKTKNELTNILFLLQV